jgi:hypothetical protein
MTKNEMRLTALESIKSSSDLAGMPDAELDAHLGALQAGSPQWFRVMLDRIWRKGSRLPLATVDKSQ